MNIIQNKNEIKIHTINAMLALYCAIIFFGVLSVSMMPFISMFERVRNFLIILLFLISITTQKHTLLQWIWLGIGISICIFSFLFAYSDRTFLLMIIIMFSMSTVSPEKLLKFSILMILISLFIICLLALLGIIPNLIFYRNGAIRYSLGTMYPLTFAGFIFYCCAAGIILISNSSSSKNWIIDLILILASIFVYKVNGARNDAFNILILILCRFSKFLPDKINKILTKISSIIVCSIAFLTIFISNIIPYTSNLYGKMNDLFSGRLQLQYTLFSMYTPKLLEQNIPQNGLGRATTTVMNYFYIDSSYVRLLFMGGILLFLLFGVTFLLFLLRMINCNMYLIVYIALVIVISGITEDAVINPIMNIFLPLLLMKHDLILKDFKK